MELLNKTELLENTDGSLKRLVLISVLSKMQIPSLIHLLQELCKSILWIYVFFKMLGEIVICFNFYYFFCLSILIPFLNQTAFVLLSHRVTHRYPSTEFDCWSFSCSLVACIHSQQRKCSALKILRVELNHSLPET